jgi:predicted adenine nucleotide alpha hydrolase (AANH) superfamily ATPase
MKVVLHICCGVCAAGAAHVLLAEGHEVTGYYYNPNISPSDEYYRRLDAASKAAARLGFQLVEGPYNAAEWSRIAAPLASEPEGGKRCQACYRIRLQQTYLYTLGSNTDAFTSTLTISPHKSALIINQIGQETGRDKFLPRDFKKKEGFKKATQMARDWGLYRQNYCGCEYSLRERKDGQMA